MRQVIKPDHNKDVVAIDNISNTKLYISISSDKSYYILTALSHDDTRYRWIALNTSYTRNNAIAYNSGACLHDAILTELKADSTVLQFDSMKELMQYCLDKWK